MANTPQAEQAIDRAHSTRNEKLAQAWREIVSRKATEAGWFPALALSSAANIKAFASMAADPVAYRKQFCVGLKFAARTSRPNDTTHAEVLAILAAMLSPEARREIEREPPLAEVFRAELEEIERVRRVTDGQAYAEDAR